MTRPNRRRSQFFANSMHRDLFVIIFLAAIIPAILASVALFYLIFSITAEEIGFPEAVATTVIPAASRVLHILSLVIPAVIFFIMILAHRITHQIIGPFDRIVRELDESVDGKRQGPIWLRKNDKFAPLVEKINLLINRSRQS